MGEIRNESELEALLNAAVDAIIVADERGHIIRCNSAGNRLFGYDAGELSGQNVSVLMPKREAKRHDAYIAHHLATGETRIIGRGRELEGKRKDGRNFPLHLSIGRSDTANGVRFVAIMHDLSRRRASEVALARSQRMEAVGQMTGGIAHDFNNLLTLIIGNLELATHRDITPEVRELIHDALDAAELGADLTTRMLAFARQSRLAPEKLRTNGVVERILGLSRNSLSQGHRLDFAPGKDIWDIYADQTELQSALVNLLRNAGDAIEGKGVILVGTENVDIDETYLAQELDIRPGRYVRISVSDSGVGMSAEDRRRAFEPFFTTKPPGQGTGLGLATTYGFVRQSGGHVTIYSEPGQGTTVNLYLPAKVSDEAAAKDDATPVETPLPGNGELILVVEDDDAVRRMTGVRLAALGYEVVEARSADEAISLLKDTPGVAMVLSDMMMPGDKTGLDLAWHMRRFRPEIPVLLTTGYAGEMTDAEIVDGFGLIRKPYRQEDLAAALRRTLARVGTTPTRD